MTEATFQSGCTYWPRQKGALFLAGEERFDRGEVRDEFSHLADMGFSFVRVPLLWESLQPEPQRLRASLLDQVIQLLDAAEAQRLTVQVVLMGRLGETLFLPDWLLASTPERTPLPARVPLLSNGWEPLWSPANLYEEEELLAGQRWLWQTLTETLAGHPALALLDLGAGGLLSSVPSRVPDAPFRWWEHLAEGATASSPALPCCYSDGAALLAQPGLPRLNEWQEVVGQLALAASPAGSAFARSATDEVWPLFLLRLAHTLARAPVACASLGVPTHVAPNEERRRVEAAQADFFGEVLPALHAQGVPYVCHAAWADAPESLHRTPPYDRAPALRDSGLLRADGSEKEVCARWRSFHAGLAGQAAGQAARALTLDEQEWYDRRQEAGFIVALYQRYLAGEV